MRVAAPTPQAHGVRMGLILPFPERPPAIEVTNDRVAALMVAMETVPWRAPDIRLVQGVDDRWRVRVTAGGQTALLSPTEARLCASAVFAENALPGSGEVSARLRSAADRCDTGESPISRHGVTGIGTLIGFAGVALMVIAVLLGPTLGGGTVH